jgi:hypothetical protein
MPALYAIRGRIVDLRRYTNVHLYWRRPPGPTDRYELWLRQDDGIERKFMIHTRIMPARRGHRVSLIAMMDTNPLQVLGLFNGETMDAVNYMRSDPPSVLLGGDFIVLALAFAVMAAKLGDVGMVLFAPAALTYLLAAAFGRAFGQALRTKQVDCVIAQEQARAGKRKVSQ